MELKLINNVTGEQYQPSINRTKVELKLSEDVDIKWQQVTINRTKVELKPNMEPFCFFDTNTINRTKVELKRWKIAGRWTGDRYQSYQSGIETKQ